MKKHFLTILIIFQLSAAFSQIGTVTNIQVSQRTDGSGKVDVYFDLNGTANNYNISMEVSYSGGSSYLPDTSSFLSGDVSNINPGNGKHLIWNGMESFPNTYSVQAKLKLIAIPN